MKSTTPIKDLELENCPRCGYSLRSLTGTQCPECGGDAALFARMRTVDDQHSAFIERCGIGGGYGLFLMGLIATAASLENGSPLLLCASCGLFVVAGLLLFVWRKMEDRHPLATMLIGAACGAFGLCTLYASI